MLTIIIITLVALFNPVKADAEYISAYSIVNPGLEEIETATGFATGWIRGVGPGTQASAEIDDTTSHSGSRCLRMTDATPTEAYKYLLVNTDWLEVQPETTYEIRFWAKGHNVGKCFVGAALEGAGEHRQALPTGDYDWQEITCRVTTTADCNSLSIRFLADGVTDALWIDDVSFMRSDVQLTKIREAQEPRPFNGWFPRTPGQIPQHLTVMDISGQSPDINAALVTLQGIVNRNGPRLYLINPTNPAGYDKMWLSYMQEKGYTGAEVLQADPLKAIEQFRDAIQGVIIWDPELPGSINAAWMLAGLLDALPVSPELAEQLKLPIVEDLRGRWQRNVDAYRYVYDNYWNQMCHHVLAWEYPLNTAISSRDYMVQHKIFMFWVSAYTDNEKGADPQAEIVFVEELLSKTPGNVPVMGWPMYLDRGIEEYTAVRLLSEYGKWVPGTGFNSNVSVHSAIQLASNVFRQAFRDNPPAPVKFDPGKIYISMNILDSGDAHWYWQFYQRQIWADPVRGSLPIGYAMNMTIVDTLPLVAQWYYENMTPNDSFFGFLYMNAPVYASRFCEEDRKRIWGEYISMMDSYRKQMDMDGIELYNGSTSGASAPVEMLQQFTRQMPGLSYILADLGRHTDITPENANTIVDDVAVLHTLTNFRVWTTSEEVVQRTMESENTWLVEEIKANSPTTRPGFMSALAVSWSYYPAWLKDLQNRLQDDYVFVSPGELARLMKESKQ